MEVEVDLVSAEGCFMLDGWSLQCDTKQLEGWWSLLFPDVVEKTERSLVSLR